MPQKQEKPKAPSPEERNKLLDESMQRAYAKVSAEMPDVKRVSVTPRASSIFSRFFMPRGAQAITNPFTGNITYNPEQMQGVTQDEIEQMIAHELTHVKQTQNTPWYKMVGQVFQSDPHVPAGIKESSPFNNAYYWKPREMEAFQAENNRAQRLHIPYLPDPITGTRDIQLPSARKKVNNAVR